MDKSSDYFLEFVRLEPPATLCFDPESQGKSTSDVKNNDMVTHLKIHNSAAANAGKNIAFKIKTTAPKFYQVKPFQGIVEPMTTSTIEIDYVPIPVSLIVTLGQSHQRPQIPGANGNHQLGCQ